LTNQTDRTLAWVWAAVTALETRRPARAAAVEPAYQCFRRASNQTGSTTLAATMVSPASASTATAIAWA
jgi:hypothetical protein